MPILTVIVGSIRPGRAGQPIAEWFIDRARALPATPPVAG